MVATGVAEEAGLRIARASVSPPASRESSVMVRLPAAPIVAAQRRHRFHRIHAASLRASESLSRQADPRKQETPTLPGIEVSTDPRQEMADGMAARAKCDRDRL